MIVYLYKCIYIYIYQEGAPRLTPASCNLIPKGNHKMCLIVLTLRFTRGKNMKEINIMGIKQKKSMTSI